MPAFADAKFALGIKSGAAIVVLPGQPGEAGKDIDVGDGITQLL
jgi:hypothetical protein